MRLATPAMNSIPLMPPLWRKLRGGSRNYAQIAVWCFGPEGYLPVGDVMLAEKIALETDEHAALAVANRSH